MNKSEDLVFTISKHSEDLAFTIHEHSEVGSLVLSSST